jgi:glycosyltransferase involved in cell wall biosynthesis
MPKVVIVGRQSFPGGGAPSSRLRAFACALASAGMEVVVIAGQKVDLIGEAPAELRLGSVTCRLLSGSTRTGLAGRMEEIVHLSRSLDQVLARERVAAVVNYNQTIAEPIALIARARRVPFIQQFAEHQEAADFSSGRLSPHLWWQRWTARIFPRFVGGAIVISEFLKDLCLERGLRRVVVVPALAPPELCAKPQQALQARDEPSRVTLTYLGGGARRDLLPRLFEYGEALRRSGLDCRVRVLGLGREVLSATASSVGAETRSWLELGGRLDDRDVRATLTASTALVLLRGDDVSSRASFPTRIPEYLLTGRPVICSPVGDLPNYLSDGGEALFVDAFDPAQMVRRTRAVLESPELARCVGEAGRRACLREFDPYLFGERLRDFVLQVAAADG